jgi:hypothetical protein
MGINPMQGHYLNTDIPASRGSELITPVFEWVKTVYALDCSTTMRGYKMEMKVKFFMQQTKYMKTNT